MKISLRALTVFTVIGAFAATSCFDGGPYAQKRGGGQAETEAPKPIEKSPPLPAGSYEIQNASYDDATGLYRLFLLGVPQGRKPLYQHTDVQMARLSDEELAAGKKSALRFDESEAPVLYLTPDFQISYVHNLTEDRIDPATQRAETVVVGQQTSMWSPFMSAMAGAAIGNMLFSPRYYFPPPYSPGGMIGYGGEGQTRALASQAYAQRFGNEPNAVKLSKTGMAPRRVSPDSLRSTGSGAGSSRLKKATRPTAPPRRKFGFGRRR
jgi:hypothetical protein